MHLVLSDRQYLPMGNIGFWSEIVIGRSRVFAPTSITASSTRVTFATLPCESPHLLTVHHIEGGKVIRVMSSNRLGDPSAPFVTFDGATGERD